MAGTYVMMCRRVTRYGQTRWVHISIVHFILQSCTIYCSHFLALHGLTCRIIHGLTCRIIHGWHVESYIDYCSFCNQYPETIVHLFWECRHVDLFGRSLKTWLTNDFNNDVFCNWSKIEIILGNRRTQKDSSIITLLSKQYIYKCKLKHFIASIEPFKLHLRAYILSERCHVLMSGTFDKFFQTWKSFVVFWRRDQP